MKPDTEKNSSNSFSNEKILLVLMPFWDPQIPPMGLACLKSYLQQHGFSIKAVDTNVEVEFRDTYDKYFNLLNQYIPAEKRGNIYNIGNQVLRNHLTAHCNYTDEAKYTELVKTLVQKTFFCDLAVRCKSINICIFTGSDDIPLLIQGYTYWFIKIFS